MRFILTMETIHSDRGLKPFITWLLLAALVAGALLRPGAAVSESDRVGELIQELLNDPDWTVRRSAAWKLGEHDDQRAVPALIAALGDRPDIPGMAAEALKKIVDAHGLPLLLSLLGAERTDVRRWAAQNMASEGTRKPEAAKALQAAMRARDLDVICGGRTFFIERGESASQNLLIEALNTCGDQAIATDFLNSGNERLEQAARDWASKHGYSVRGGAARGGPRWGGR